MVPPHLPVVTTSAGVVTVTIMPTHTSTFLVATTGEVAMMTRMLECATEAFLSALIPGWLSWRTDLKNECK